MRALTYVMAALAVAGAPRHDVVVDVGAAKRDETRLVKGLAPTRSDGRRIADLDRMARKRRRAAQGKPGKRARR